MTSPAEPATAPPAAGPGTAGLRTSGLWTAAQIGLGVGLVGAAGYVFVAVIGRVFEVPPHGAEVSALSSVYLLINILGPGLFIAVEQETNRAVSASTALGVSLRPAAARAARLACGLLAVMAVVLALLWSPVLSRVLDHRLSLLAALMLAGVGAALVYWTRGMLAGQQRFGAYAVTMYVEGGVRLVGCLALVAGAVEVPGAYGLVFAGGSLLAGAAVLPVVRPGPHEDAHPQLARMARSLLLLVSATLLAQLVANLAPVVVAYRLPGDPARASTFTAAFVLARIPLFLFAPAQSLLLPSLSRAATHGRLAQVRSQVRLVLLAVLAVGVPGAILAALVGPWAVQVLFHAAQRPSSGTLAVLGGATLLMMAVQVLQAALVALQAQRTVTCCWAAGTVVFLAVLVVPRAPLTAALWAQLLGPAVVAGAMLTTLLVRLAAGSSSGPPLG